MYNTFKHFTHTLTAVSILLSTLYADEMKLWTDALSQPQGVIPTEPAQDTVVWRTDLQEAIQEAKAAKRPLFVTLRCLPCKQCSSFDKDVLDGGSTLTPLLQQFITVRVTDAGKIDERYLPFRDYQDLDLSWWGYFLSPEGRLYGVYGGKDHVSDATRISEDSLVNTMKRILAHHYDPRRPSWDIDGKLPEGNKPELIEDSTGYKKLVKRKKHIKKAQCLHCHEVGDMLNLELEEKNQLTADTLQNKWPLPENLGIHLDRDEGILVKQVDSGSVADKAGIKSGDYLAMADRQKLFGQADFRGVLHRADPGDTQILLGWTSNGEAKFANLQLQDGWKKGINWWRKTVYDGIFGPTIGFFPIPGPKQGKGNMSFKAFIGKNPKGMKKEWQKAGVTNGMHIVEINGRTDDWNVREFLTWFRTNHKLGDTVTVKNSQGKNFEAKLKEK